MKDTIEIHAKKKSRGIVATIKGGSEWQTYKTLV